MIAIRKDIDKEKFAFPKPFDNGLRLKDILENHVEQKFLPCKIDLRKAVSHKGVHKDIADDGKKYNDQRIDGIPGKRRLAPGNGKVFKHELLRKKLGGIHGNLRRRL